MSMISSSTGVPNFKRNSKLKNYKAGLHNLWTGSIQHEEALLLGPLILKMSLPMHRHVNNHFQNSGHFCGWHFVTKRGLKKLCTSLRIETVLPLQR